MFVDIFNTDRKYNIIYADPPWQYGDRKVRGGAEHHYQTMKIEDICNLPINNISADNCVLFMWTTYPMLPDALKLIEAWGFKYKTLGFQWIKLNKSGKGHFFGLGRWTRGNTEPCLIAIKGKPARIDNSVSQIIETPIEAHSKKPGVVRRKIVQLIGDLPRIELFARQESFGWDCWGNEIERCGGVERKIWKVYQKIIHRLLYGIWRIGRFDDRERILQYGLHGRHENVS